MPSPKEWLIKIRIEFIPSDPIVEGSVSDQKMYVGQAVISNTQLKAFPGSTSAYVRGKSGDIFRELKAEVKKAIGVTI